MLGEIQHKSAEWATVHGDRAIARPKLYFSVRRIREWVPIANANQIPGQPVLGWQRIAVIIQKKDIKN